MENWHEHLERHFGKFPEFRPLIHGLPEAVETVDWIPRTNDRKAAWFLYTEMRTRIATQPLHFTDGREDTALDSIYAIFEHTRSALNGNYPCLHFSEVSTFVLNEVIRPFTAKWHPRREAGALENDDDARRNFRAELMCLQERLRVFEVFLSELATNVEPVVEREKDGRLSTADLGGGFGPEWLGEKGPSEIGDAILEAERGDLLERRKTYGLEKEDAGTQDLHNATGLALSGGGIRSATFCLGVVQRLAHRGLLPSLDYLSTVSGGGYLGTFISTFVDSEKDEVSLEPGPKTLPFGADGNQESDTIAVRHLRNSSKYLVDGGFLTKLKIAGVMLFGIVANFLSILPLILIAIFLTKGVHDCAWFKSLLVWGARGGAAFLGVAFLLYAFAGKNGISRLTDAAKWIALGGAGLMAGAMAILGLEALYRMENPFSEIEVFPEDWQNLSIAAAIPALLAVGRKLLSMKTWMRSLVQVLILVSGAVFLAVLFVTLCGWFIPNSLWWVIGVFLVICAIDRFCLDTNHTSPHGFYRDRLASCYVADYDDKRKPCVNGGVIPTPLADLNKHRKTPYHLINGVINAPASTNPELRGRNSDFFFFSKYFCGSLLSGFLRIKDPATDETPRPPDDLDEQALEKVKSLDIASAMAVSAAAASPHMGVRTANFARFWMAMFNVRLGLWLANPNASEWRRRLRKIFGGPGPGHLIAELTGNVHERGAFINLSDGGHIENLGAYELLRRRCKFIIAVDGGKDSEGTCGDVMNLKRFAAIDLGTELEINISNFAPNEHGYSRSHYSLGRIRYPGGKIGWLLYLKLSLTGNERGDLMKYRREHPDFPHESTGDQVFEEDQFESYRALGYHAAGDLFESELAGIGNGRFTGDSRMADWFQVLADNLWREGLYASPPEAESPAEEPNGDEFT